MLSLALALSLSLSLSPGLSLLAGTSSSIEKLILIQGSHLNVHAKDASALSSLVLALWLPIQIHCMHQVSITRQGLGQWVWDLQFQMTVVQMKTLLLAVIGHFCMLLSVTWQYLAVYLRAFGCLSEGHALCGRTREAVCGKGWRELEKTQR